VPPRPLANPKTVLKTRRSNIDHFIPGLAVDRMPAGSNTSLALTYYSEQPAGCVGLTCTIQANFSSSLDNGQTWSTPQKLSEPMQLAWIAPTTQGAMVGDYISTAFLAGQQRVIGAIAIGFPPPSTGMFDEPMFAALQNLRPGTNRAGKDPVQVTAVDTADTSTTL
jgi:hypothetical protein